MPPREGRITERQERALTALGIGCEHLHRGNAKTLLDYLFRGDYDSDNAVADQERLAIYRQKKTVWVGQYVEVRNSGRPGFGGTPPTRGEIVRVSPRPADAIVGISNNVVGWMDDRNWTGLLLLPNGNLKSGSSLASLIPAPRPQPRAKNKKRRKRS